CCSDAGAPVAGTHEPPRRHCCGSRRRRRVITPGRTEYAQRLILRHLAAWAKPVGTHPAAGCVTAVAPGVPGGCRERRACPRPPPYLPATPAPGCVAARRPGCAPPACGRCCATVS